MLRGIGMKNLQTLNEKEILTRKETAVYLSVCVTTLDKLPIPRIKTGRCVRFKKSILDNWLNEQSKPKQEVAV